MVPASAGTGAGRAPSGSPHRDRARRRRDPQQRRDMFTPRPVEKEVVPSDEVGDKILNRPTGTEGAGLPLLGREFSEETPKVAPLLTHELSARSPRSHVTSTFEGFRS